MKLENFIIEDAADANYVIRKFFNNEFAGIKMSQLEQLVLAVYDMGKNNGASVGTPAETAVINPFKISDRARTVEDMEIAHSGEFIKADTEVTVSLVAGETVSFLFESDETGEMIEATVPYNKLEKVT